MNNITLAGSINSDITFSHEAMHENFNEFYIASARESGYVDRIKCIISDSMSKGLKGGDAIELQGEIRTKNKQDANEVNHLDVFVFVKRVFEYSGKDKNCVEMNGFICKEPIYRETPLGRQICDLLVASNRYTGKSDYIPCISWGRNAIKSSTYNVAEHVEIAGRLQSREYIKRFEDGTEENRVAYELSVNNIYEIEKEEE